MTVTERKPKATVRQPQHGGVRPAGASEIQPGPTQWHELEPAAALAQLAVTEAGLDTTEAATRRAAFGPNELVERGAKSPWRILWEQFTATMVLVLVAAAVLYAAVSGLGDALPIIAIVVLFGLLGFAQEYRAERAMAALKQLAVPSVRVRRAGQVRDISARELVPGDLVLLEAGNVVPADARLIDGANLRVQEAALTGESEAVEKRAAALPAGSYALGDRANMVYMGTTVAYGRGLAMVTATGMRTELGRIATLLEGVQQEHTPLQRRLDQVGRVVAAVAIAIAVLILGLGILQGQRWTDMLLTAISVAVAAVPEGLPAVVTITLALGAQRMLRRNALLRKLPAVETLGSVTVIASDKTGTLTENRMTVTVLELAGQQVALDQPLDAAHTRSAGTTLLLGGGALCNDAVLQFDGPAAVAVGDPTEGALLLVAHRFAFDKAALEQRFARVVELPFDAERKRMTTVHRIAGPGNDPLRAALAAAGSVDYVAFTKGSADGLLDIASHVWVDGHVEPLTAAWRARIHAGNDRLAADGMRVLGVAFRPLAVIPPLADLERQLVFVGLVGMIDPPRREVRAAVATAREAGIRPIMITGDHGLTAIAIARQLGITADDRVLTGAELDRLSPAELADAVDTVSVYARVSPEHKLKIVDALQAKGHVVAMTGDGVNDAPALKKADIGVAMGITGTDVSKEAADMVLRDDNFATIVAAVEEGRTIYDNLRKFITFSIAGNIGKVLTVFAGTVLLGPLLGLPLVLLPLQLLWLNFLTDGLLGLGLGLEPGERSAMRRPPIKPGASIFADGVGRQIAWSGLLIGALALLIGVLGWYLDQPTWQTLIFTTLAFAQVGQALAIRSSSESLFQIGLGSNRALLLTMVTAVGLQLLVLYWTPLQTTFGTMPLSLPELALSFAAGAVVFGALELAKWRARRRRPELSTTAPLSAA